MTFFAPDNFKDDPYGHATNQISHCALSLFLCYASGMPLLIAAGWMMWEGYHLIVSRDWKDGLEDLFFELSGVVTSLLPVWSYAVAAAILITTYLRMRAK